jgi:hypothetical protein
MKTLSSEAKKSNKLKKTQKINNFWKAVEIESTRIEQYQQEESYSIVMEMIHKQAAIVQKGLTVGGTGRVASHVPFPKQFFCAVVASLSVDHKADFAFR